MDNKISVIVPIFNIASYIERAINSIINQTYSNLEIILVNDGSTDNSLEVIRELEKKDNRIIVIDKPNGGVTSARLEGIKKSTGDWIGFVDGDDYIEPEMYEFLLNNALKENADISHCGYQMVFPSRVDYYYNTGKRVVQDNLQGLKDLLSGRFVEPSLNNKLYKRRIVIGIFDSNCLDLEIKNNEDFLMNYYLFKYSNKSIFDDNCLYHYILRRDSASTVCFSVNKLCDGSKVRENIYIDNSITELQNILTSILTSSYVSISTCYIRKFNKIIKPYRLDARRKLKRMDLSLCSKKTRLKARWVKFWPWSYYICYKFYAFITGKNKKYRVE